MVAKSTIFSLDSASYEAKIVSKHKTISALHKTKPRLSREAKATVLCTNSEATAGPLTSSALLGSARLATSGRTKALNALIASSCEADLTLCRVQPRLSREAKVKAPLCAKSVADSASLSLSAPSAKVLSREPKNKALSAKDLYRDARDKAPLGANRKLF